jgi:hypothetical protein
MKKSIKFKPTKQQQPFGCRPGKSIPHINTQTSLQRFLLTCWNVLISGLDLEKKLFLALWIFLKSIYCYYIIEIAVPFVISVTKGTDTELL